MIPHSVLQALREAPLPCFVYDAAVVKERAMLAASLLDGWFYPLKACPEPGIVRAALAAGGSLDLCSAGDVDLAVAVGCPRARWKFTAACADDELLRRLVTAGARLDADSLEQALRWGACGGKACGLRLRAAEPKALYGWKFGLAAEGFTAGARRLADAGVRVEGLHLHDQHANLSPSEFAARLIATLTAVPGELLRRCAYVNLGGSWPMRHGVPASVEELQPALGKVRERLASLGFGGELYGEPGRWVVGPCGYWASRVSAVKPHPRGGEHRVVVLDTNAPVPCKPSVAPFVVLRQGALAQGPNSLTCDLFGSANTALDCIGLGVRLPALEPGDVVVASGQGAYTRQLIPPFNERERPEAVITGTQVNFP